MIPKRKSDERQSQLCDVWVTGGRKGKEEYGRTSVRRSMLCLVSVFAAVWCCVSSRS